MALYGNVMSWLMVCAPDSIPKLHKGFLFVFSLSLDAPRTNSSRVKSVGMSRIEANRQFRFWHALYLKNIIDRKSVV